ncbi:MAG TPA: nitrite reductase small subunit NirD [Propionibacteriaceae bacterium]|nr:nitrite reductase small subunit NirD [Propionibacteriaceae bacterium]
MTDILERTRLEHVCRLDQLTPGLGVAALIGEVQVAVFLVETGELYAVQNLCPFSGASVISRGITGSRLGEPTIASPVYKQVFSLVTGECLASMDKAPKAGLEAGLRCFPVVVRDGDVYVDLGRP